MSLTYEVFEDRRVAGDWRVEAIDHDGDGECYVAIFAGPRANERAEAYGTWLNGLEKLNAGRAAYEAKRAAFDGAPRCRACGRTVYAELEMAENHRFTFGHRLEVEQPASPACPRCGGTVCGHVTGLPSVT